MNDHSEQIARIKTKLSQAKKADNTNKVFGADSHKYEINEPASEEEVAAFEEEYGVQLPECYRAFVLQVGNGGTGYYESAPGPFYGIYPFGDSVTELVSENAEKHLGNDCLLYPKMTDDYWQSLNKRIDGDDVSDDVQNQELEEIFGGILPIGSQGCTYLHGLVLNGPYKGRVVNLDMDRQKPKFTFEHNFLDWYERWLDEVISGELITDEVSWFGFCKGGTEEELLNGFLIAASQEDKQDCLNGLFTKKKLNEQTLVQVEAAIPANPEHKNTLIQLLCRSGYEKAKPYLLEMVETDLLTAMQFIYWYAKDKSKEWQPLLTAQAGRINDATTFEWYTNILKEAGGDNGPLIAAFAKSEDEAIRYQVIYSLGEVSNKKDYTDLFIEGLHSDSNKIIHAALQSLEGIKDERLLPHYKQVAEKFPEEVDYILANLDNRLADYGLNKETVKGIGD